MKRLVKKAEEILNINNGDYVDFGPYGQLFVIIIMKMTSTGLLI